MRNFSCYGLGGACVKGGTQPLNLTGAESPRNKPPKCSGEKWVALHAAKSGFPSSTLLPGRPSGPIAISTIVPLTMTVLKPTLYGIESCPTYQGRRRPSEKMGRAGVYRLGTGSSPECLDMCAIKDRLHPGFFLPGRHNVTETRGYSPGHARSGRSDGSENGSRRA
jgi:hypothetical protein